MPPSFFLYQLEVGLLQNFNYLIGDPATKECAYIDPAWEVDRLLRVAQENNFRITKILLTHRHFDHVEGVEAVVQQTGAEVFIHSLDEKPVREVVKTTPVVDGVKIPIGNLLVTPLHTPGHTEGSTCYLVTDPETSRGHLFTGDTLFQGNCGRCDLPGGNAKTLFKSLGKLKSLDPATKIYPGHDYGTQPVTTLSYEKQHNPPLRATSFEEFDQLP